MLPAQGQGLIVQLLGACGAGAVAVAVGWGEHGIGLLAPAPQELADRTPAQAERLRDGGGSLATPVAA
jgi:hypothetical protein